MMKLLFLAYLLITIFSVGERQKLDFKDQKKIHNNLKNDKKLLVDPECPDIPENFKEIVDGSKPGYGESVYVCKAQYSEIFQVSSGQLVISHCSFNEVKPYFGGPLFLSCSYANSLPQDFSLIEYCTFTKNSGPYSGAIYALAGANHKVRIENCKFEGNSCSIHSGSITFKGHNAEIQKCNFKNDLGSLDGDEIFIEYQGPDNIADTNIKISDNVFQRTVTETGISSLIYFSNLNNRFRFELTGNKVNIDCPDTTVYLLNCNADDKFVGTANNNFITSSNKDNVIGPNLKDDKDANFTFDFDKDFQATPTVPPEIITENSACSVTNFFSEDQNGPEIIEDRCVYPSNTDKMIFVDIIRSSFNEFKVVNENGGAINLVNCPMNCKKATFSKCSSEKGGGGAIYIKNSMYLANNVDMKDLKFIECSANYGGAVYVFFNSEKNEVTINRCIFDRNFLLTNNNNKNEMNGGIAMLLICQKATIDECNFINNKGSGGIVKYSDNFENFRSISSKLNNVCSFSVNNCVFVQSPSSDVSVLYSSNKGGNAKVDIVECTFKGRLKRGCHYISSSAPMKKSAKNVNVVDCKFEHTGQQAVKVETKFNVLLAVAACVTVAVLIVVVIVVVRRKVVSESKSEEEEEEERDEQGDEVEKLPN